MLPFSHSRLAGFDIFSFFFCSEESKTKKVGKKNPGDTPWLSERRRMMCNRSNKKEERIYTTQQQQRQKKIRDNKMCSANNGWSEGKRF
jgi:hypothetical protein